MKFCYAFAHKLVLPTRNGWFVCCFFFSGAFGFWFFFDLKEVSVYPLCSCMDVLSVCRATLQDAPPLMI